MSPTQDLTEATGEESEDHPPHTEHRDSNDKSYFAVLSPESAEVRPPRPATSKVEVTRSTYGRHGQALYTSPGSGLVSAQPQDSDATPLRNSKTGADPIRKALLRSSRVRREVKVDAGSSAVTKQSGEQTQESFRASQNKTMEEEESASNRESVLLGYDAQWCWVESQDDVTFL